MQIFFILYITLMRHVLIGTTLEVGRPTRDSISSKSIVIGIFGLNAIKPNAPFENHNEKIFRIPKKDNFNERILADLYYNDNMVIKPLVQIQPLTTKLISRPYYPILFNELPIKCCIERGNSVLNNKQFVKQYILKDELLTTSNLLPLITNNKGSLGHKDDIKIDGIETKKEIKGVYQNNQSRIYKTNQEQPILVPNHSDNKTEKNIPAYNSENSKKRLVDHLSQLKNVGNDDLKDIQTFEEKNTFPPATAYGQIEEVMSTTDVSVDIKEDIEKNDNSLYDTNKSEPVNSNNNINIDNTTEQSKINGSEMKNKKDSLQDIFKTNDVWPQLYSSLTTINNSIPLRAFQNVFNDFMSSDFKSKNQSSQKRKYVKGSVVKQRIIMNSDNYNDDNIAYIKNKLSMSNTATLDKPISFSSEKPYLDNNDDLKTLENKLTL